MAEKMQSVSIPLKAILKYLYEMQNFNNETVMAAVKWKWVLKKKCSMGIDNEHNYTAI